MVLQSAHLTLQMQILSTATQIKTQLISAAAAATKMWRLNQAMSTVVL